MEHSAVSVKLLESVSTYQPPTFGALFTPRNFASEHLSPPIGQFQKGTREKMTCSSCLSHQSTIEANVALINQQKPRGLRLVLAFFDFFNYQKIKNWTSVAEVFSLTRKLEKFCLKLFSTIILVWLCYR